MWVKGRKNIFDKLVEATKGEQNIVWFHCASLGEFEQGKPIIASYKQKYSSHRDIALEGQRSYVKATLSRAGSEQFVEHFTALINKATS